MPPRHGKSELVSVFLPVWLLALRAWSRVALVGHSGDFAASWGRKVRNVVEEHSSVLPGLRVRSDSSAAHRWDTTAGGGMLAVGVEGPFTGRGADLLVVDDPHKDRDEAESEAFRARLWEWWRSTARTRLEPRGSVVVVMQRWREDDLVGRLLSEDSGEPWELVNMPAVAEEGDVLGRAQGEALWPERYDVEALDVLRRSLGSYNWASQYQQRPSPAGGAVFKRRLFRYFREHEDAYELSQPDGSTRRVPRARCVVFQTADTALEDKTTSDFTVCSTFAATPGHELLVLDVQPWPRVRLEVPDQLPFLLAQRSRWPALAWQGVERRASGHGLIQAAMRAGKPMRALEPGDRGKVQRALAAAVLYENGMVYHRSGAPWLDVLEGELLSFPTGAHDDVVDTVSYAAQESGRTEPQVFL